MISKGCSVIRIAIFPWIMNVFRCLLDPNVKVINIFFHLLLMMITDIQKTIFVMYVKNVEIQIFDFTIVQHVILLLISIVFLVTIHSSNLGVLLK
ncbi:hypothetical protein Goklo_024126 [Gossypium klotzschianum]|uniref:Uncharacterized protein n=1 Tax=Gossypium klotzschianum TaxID=34286 RepID=A0A7J8W4U0_9ROSI|nr:hypothetical protein [Gossypium klotzschianum]